MSKIRKIIFEKAKSLEYLPHCEICDKVITDEEVIYYNDQYCCKDCEQYFWFGIREDFLVKVRDCID